MSDTTLGIAVIAALACAGYLLVKHEILSAKDAAAGAGLIAAILVVLRALTKQDPNNIQTTSKQQPTKPHVTEDEIDEILREKPEPASEPDSGSDVSSDDPRDWDI